MTGSQEKKSQLGLGSRIKRAIEGLGLTIKEAAKTSGISYSSLQNWTGGHREPGPEALLALVSRLGISVDWLLTDEGPMYIHDRSSGGDGSLSGGEQAFLRLFRELEEADRHAIHSFAEERHRLRQLESRVAALAAALEAVNRSA